MQGTLLPENTMLLDRLLRTFRCEHITFDTTSILTLQTVSPNLSQFALIRIEPSFFQSYSPLGKVVSMPFQRFYRPNMRRLRIDQSGGATTLEYTFDAFTYTRRTHGVDAEPFEPDFVSAITMRVDLLCIKRLIEGVRDKFVVLTVGEDTRIECGGTLMRLDSGARGSACLRIETAPFRSMVCCSDLFGDHALVLSDTGDTLNAIFRSPDVFLSMFMTVDRV